MILQDFAAVVAALRNTQRRSISGLVEKCVLVFAGTNACCAGNDGWRSSGDAFERFVNEHPWRISGQFDDTAIDNVEPNAPT